jgi:hypothetical protein
MVGILPPQPIQKKAIQYFDKTSRKQFRGVFAFVARIGNSYAVNIRKIRIVRAKQSSRLGAMFKAKGHCIATAHRWSMVLRNSTF